MKIYISGSTHDCKWELTDSIRSYLDKIMAEDMEILIEGDLGFGRHVQDYLKSAKYKNVKICVAGSKSYRCYNAGNWPAKYYSVHGGHNGYMYSIERDFNAVAEADCGFVIWDGEWFNDFVDMLCFCALGKPCKVFHIPENRWLDIRFFDDLREFTSGPLDDISDNEKHRVLKICGFSDEMADYLVSENAVSPYELIDIICRAPVTLDDKYSLLEHLPVSFRNLEYEAFCSVEDNLKQGKDYKAIKHDIRLIADNKDIPGRESVLTYIGEKRKAVRDAKECIFPSRRSRPFLLFGNKKISFEQEGGYIDGLAHCYHPLYLFECWYDTDDLQNKNSGVGFFTDPYMAESYIKKEEVENDTGEGYYRLEAWNFSDPEWSKARYDFYYDCYARICWFEKLVPYKGDGEDNVLYRVENRDFTNGCTDLSLKTPYQTGDIVLIDCRPFAPPFHAMILEATDQYDCCFPNIVFQIPGTNDWRLTPLKHRRFLKDLRYVYEPMLSPLYRLRKVKDEELTEDDNNLLELSKLIAGDEEKAAAIWRKWERNTSEDIKWEKVKRIFKSIKE